MHFPRVFPITPCFNPICFAQSPSLLTYIIEPKGEEFHPSMESSTLGSLHSFDFLFFCNGLIFQIGLLQKQKVGLVKHVPIN